MPEVDGLECVGGFCNCKLSTYGLVSLIKLRGNCIFDSSSIVEDASVPVEFFFSSVEGTDEVDAADGGGSELEQ